MHVSQCAPVHVQTFNVSNISKKVQAPIRPKVAVVDLGRGRVPSVRSWHGWWQRPRLPSMQVLWPLHWHSGHSVKYQRDATGHVSAAWSAPRHPPGRQVPVPRFEPSSHQPHAGSSCSNDVHDRAKKR